MCGPEIRFGVGNRAEIFTRSISRQDHSLLKISDGKDQPKWKIICDRGRGLSLTSILQILKLIIFQCFLCHFVAREILHRMIYDSWGSIWLEQNIILQKSEKVGFLIENLNSFSSDSVNPQRIILIFERGRDIWETSLWAKIRRRSDDFWKSYRVNGRTDGHTDRF